MMEVNDHVQHTRDPSGDAMTRVADHEPADISHARQLRIVDSLTATLERNILFCSHDEAEACARNIAQAYPLLGIPHDVDLDDDAELARRLGGELPDPAVAP